MVNKLLCFMYEICRKPPVHQFIPSLLWLIDRRSRDGIHSVDYKEAECICTVHYRARLFSLIILTIKYVLLKLIK